jgi:hypothetical protein
LAVGRDDPIEPDKPVGRDDPIEPKPAGKSSDEIAAEEAGIERRDFMLLAGRPPRGMSISRDIEGRISVVLRRVRWLLAIVLAAVMTCFTWMVWFKFTDIPLPAKIAFAFVMLFPFAQLLFAFLRHPGSAAVGMAVK